MGRLCGGLAGERGAELLERFDLDPRKKGRAYSKGNRQKVALVAALCEWDTIIRVQVPAVWLLAGITMALFGQVERPAIEAMRVAHAGFRRGPSSWAPRSLPKLVSSVEA